MPQPTYRKPYLSQSILWIVLGLLLVSQLINLPDHRLYRESLRKADSLAFRLNEIQSQLQSLDQGMDSLQVQIQSFDQTILRLGQQAERMDLQRKAGLNKYLQQRTSILHQIDSLTQILDTTP